MCHQLSCCVCVIGSFVESHEICGQVCAVLLVVCEEGCDYKYVNKSVIVQPTTKYLLAIYVDKEAVYLFIRK